MTTTLEKAMDTARDTLPPEVQEQIAENLIAYTEKWRELKSLLDEGMTAVEAGDVVEIADVDAYINRLRAKHAG